MLSFTSPLEAIRESDRPRDLPPPPARLSCIVLAVVALFVTALMLVLPKHASAQQQPMRQQAIAQQAMAQQAMAPVRGEATVSTNGGYARLVIRTAQQVDSQIRVTGGILVVQFRQPVAVAIDRITGSAGDYFGAARRDPDGRALRFALKGKFKVNTQTAAERLFIDVMPESWSADPPGLPREVIDELESRTRAAESHLKQQQAMAALQKRIPMVKVKAATHPTFTRYIFDLPELTGVSTDRGKDKLTLTFAAPMKFDLADAKIAAPKAVASIDAGNDEDSAKVVFAFAGPVDLRTFREGNNYTVDVTPIDPKARAVPQASAPGTLPATIPAPLAGMEAPATVPAAEPKSAEAKLVEAKPAEAKPEEPKVAEKSEPAPEEPAKEAAPPPPAPKQAVAERLRDPKRPVNAEVRRQGDNLRVTFPFLVDTPAAVFQRADTLWLVFDTQAPVDAAVLNNDTSRTVKSIAIAREGEAQVLRVKLERPRMISLLPEGSGWVVVIGDSVQEPIKPLTIARHIVGTGRTSIAIPFDDPRQLHKVADPDVGDTLLIATGLGPARGLVKTQDFVELRALATTHGIVIQPFADDLSTELSADKILVSRPAGLTLSEAAINPRKVGTSRALTFNTALWAQDREAKFAERQSDLIRAAADAPFVRRGAHRLDLARFYMAQEMYAEAKSVLDLTVMEDRPTAEDPSAFVLRAVCNIMLNRTDVALKDLSNPLLGNQNDAMLWRAMAHARQGKWAEARDGFRMVEGALATLPLELQRLALRESLRSSIETGDFASASAKLNDFQTVGVPPEHEAAVAVLTGRLAEGMGRIEDAQAAYRRAANAGYGPWSAQGELRGIAVRYKQGEVKKADAIAELEKLATAWRGDETEAEALQLLARLYTEEDRYRDAFQVMRVSLNVHPNSELTRKIQQDAGETFDSLFLAGKGDAMPAVEALGLFYDFRDLTPIGRRGDEMIRRLADRLVAVDLLDQAAELLQHQVDNRLQGAARAQVATRLAIIYLLNHKPDRAQATLRATRTADLSTEVRNQRLLIEARAMSDVGRHELALEVITNVPDREAIRLRSDIYWGARQWQKSAEQTELLLGDRWRGFEPLTDIDRSDILRAAIGYALADDKIGMARLREKFTAKMAQTADRRAFEVVSGGISVNSPEFREVARMIASIDTLEGFLRDMRTRYPEINSYSSSTPSAAAEPKKPDVKASAKPDAMPTGSVKLRDAPLRTTAR
ncbi:MAG: tetratricopeptide repeat protein [Pseudomonadota bacterium]